MTTLATLCACDASPRTRLLGEATTAATVMLSDPESARFRDVRIIAPGIVCGMVNARNKMGGYDGFSTFVYVAAEGVRQGRNRDIGAHMAEDEINTPPDGMYPDDFVPVTFGGLYGC